MVGRSVGNLDGPELGLGDPQELGLASRHLPVELGVAEHARPFAQGLHLGRLALGVHAVVALGAVAAGDVERDHHPIARFQPPDARPDLLDDPHRLMADDVAFRHGRPQLGVEVEVGAADRRGGDAHDGVGGLLDHRVRHLVDPHVFPAVPHHCSHGGELPLVATGTNSTTAAARRGKGGPARGR